MCWKVSSYIRSCYLYQYNIFIYLYIYIIYIYIYLYLYLSTSISIVSYLYQSISTSIYFCIFFSHPGCFLMPLCNVCACAGFVHDHLYFHSRGCNSLAVKYPTSCCRSISTQKCVPLCRGRILPELGMPAKTEGQSFSFCFILGCDMSDSPGWTTIDLTLSLHMAGTAPNSKFTGPVLSSSMQGKLLAQGKANPFPTQLQESIFGSNM